MPESRHVDPLSIGPKGPLCPYFGPKVVPNKVLSTCHVPWASCRNLSPRDPQILPSLLFSLRKKLDVLDVQMPNYGTYAILIAALRSPSVLSRCYHQQSHLLGPIRFPMLFLL